MCLCKNSLTPRSLGTAHCGGREPRYYNSMLCGFWKIPSLRAVERFCTECDIYYGLGEEILYAQDPPCQRVISVILNFDRYWGLPLTCLGPTQKCFSECSLEQLVGFCDYCTKFMVQCHANFPSLTLPFHNVTEVRHICTLAGSTSGS